MNQPNQYPQGGYPPQPQQGQPYQQPQPQAQPYQQPQAQPYGGQQAYGGQPAYGGQQPQQGQQKERDPNDDFEFDGDVKGAENVEQVDYAFWTDIKPSWGKLTDDPQLVVGTWPAIVISSKTHDDVHYVTGKNLGKKIKMFVGLDCGPNGPRKTVLEINPTEQSFLFKRLLDNVAPDLVGIKFKAWKLKGRRFWASIRFGSAGSKWAEDGENPQLRIRGMQPWNGGQPPQQPVQNGQSQLFTQGGQQAAPQQQAPQQQAPQQQGYPQGQHPAGHPAQQQVAQQSWQQQQQPQQAPQPQQPQQQGYQGGYGGQNYGTRYGGAPQTPQGYGAPQAPGAPGEPAPAPAPTAGYPADDDLPF